MTTSAVTFVVPGAPVSKGRPRVGARGTYTPARTKEYEDKVAAEYLRVTHRYNREPEGRYALDLTIKVSSRRRQDLDNVIKSVMDGLNGVAYADDSQVDRISVSRVFEAGAEPWVRVQVSRLA